MFDPAAALRASLREPASALLDDHGGAPLTLTSVAAIIHSYDLAQLLVLRDEGIIDPKLASECLAILAPLDPEVAAQEHPAGLWYWGEAKLIEALGIDRGGVIHTGRSTHDLCGVVWRVQTREALLAVLEALGDFRRAYLDAAESYLQYAMPLHTHRVEALSTTLGHYLHSFAVTAQRDHERLAEAYRAVNICPAGAAAGVGTAFALDRVALASWLGFDEAGFNTLDALRHDSMWQAAAATGILVANLAGVAEELFTWSRSGFIDLPDRWCRSSSLMPGKRSVTAIEEFAQLAHDRIGGRSPTSYPVWYWTEQLERQRKALWLLRVLEQIVGDMTVDRESMGRAAVDHWGPLTELAAALVRDNGLAWRVAHQLLAVVARRAREAGRDPQQLDVEFIEHVAEATLGRRVGLHPVQLSRAWNAAQTLADRSVRGAPAPALMQEALGHARQRLTQDQATLTRWRASLQAARQGLLDHAREG